MCTDTAGFTIAHIKMKTALTIVSDHKACLSQVQRMAFQGENFSKCAYSNRLDIFKSVKYFTNMQCTDIDVNIYIYATQLQ